MTWKGLQAWLRIGGSIVPLAYATTKLPQGWAYFATPCFCVIAFTAGLMALHAMSCINRAARLRRVSEATNLLLDGDELDHEVVEILLLDAMLEAAEQWP